jgi:hypothetical protein
MAQWIRALLLIALLGTRGADQPPPELKTFRSVQGRFTVRVPGVPEEQAQTAKPGDTSPVTHTFILGDEAAAYIMTYTDFSAEQVSKAKPSAIITSARDGGINNVKGHLVSESDITVNGFPGRDVIASVPLGDKQGSARFRIVLAKTRLYVVLYVGPAGTESSAQINDYLKSFQILDAEPADGWKTFTSPVGKFTVRLPGAPKEDTTDLSGGGKLHQFALDKGDYAYIVCYNAIADGAPKPESVSALLNKGRDAMMASLKGKLLDEKSVSLAGNPGKALRIAIPAQNGVAYVRGYIVGDQYYQVMLIGTLKSMDVANPDRYFASFQFTGGAPSTEWKNFVSKEDLFSIDLPGTPKRETGQHFIAKYQADYADTAYIVVRVDLKPAITDPDQITAILKGARDAEAKGLGAQIVSEKRVPLMGVSGLQANLSIPDPKIPGGGNGIERFYLVGTRLYEVAVITSNKKLDESAFARFFDSFKPDSP